MRSSIYLLLLAAACSDSDDSTSVELQEVVEMPALANRDLDILFVTDSSPSMLEEQQKLVASFPQMMDVLSELDGGLPNLHIAVTTSDLGAASLASPQPTSGGIVGCTASGDGGAFQVGVVDGPGALTGNFIEDVDDGAGGRTRNYTGALRDVFAEITSSRFSGCGFEQHLSAMQRALDNPTNAGFLRPDANLAIVFLADEDDCSMAVDGFLGPEDAVLGARTSFRCTRFGITCDQDIAAEGVKTNCVPDPASPYLGDVQLFIDNLLARKTDPRQIMVAAIVGDADPVEVSLEPYEGNPEPGLRVMPSCTATVTPNDWAPTGISTAFPAVRINAFASAFEGRNLVSSVCADDLAQGLTGIGATAKKLVGDPCIETAALADGSPEPGTQPTCEVVDVAGDVTAAVPACTDGTSDCFELVRDTTACPRESENLRIALRRARTLSANTWTHVRCVPRQ